MLELKEKKKENEKSRSRIHQSSYLSIFIRIFHQAGGLACDIRVFQANDIHPANEIPRAKNCDLES